MISKSPEAFQPHSSWRGSLCKASGGNSVTAWIRGLFSGSSTLRLRRRAVIPIPRGRLDPAIRPERPATDPIIPSWQIGSVGPARKMPAPWASMRRCKNADGSTESSAIYRSCGSGNRLLLRLSHGIQRTNCLRGSHRQPRDPGHRQSAGGKALFSLPSICSDLSPSNPLRPEPTGARRWVCAS